MTLIEWQEIRFLWWKAVPMLFQSRAQQESSSVVHTYDLAMGMDVSHIMM
ncbi:hypothetical protein Q427_33740 [Halomonas sp. BC04]|nr:hypothetical protein Q427_33740 [Halomonas sp. BC04]